MNGVKDILTLPTKIWGVLAITGTALLLGKNFIESYTGGKGFYDSYGMWIAVITLLSYAFLITEVCLHFWRNHKAKADWADRLSYMNNLTSDKMEIVRRLYLSPTHVLTLTQNAEQVRELEANLVIGRTSNQKIVYGTDLENLSWDYLLEPWVVHAIDNHEIKIK